MKILFVSSGNAKGGISPIVLNQGQSLIDLGLEVHFFSIRGKGFWSYLRHISFLRRHLKTNTYDLVHSHYSFTSFISAIANAKPLVVSLMGSDVMSDKLVRPLIIFFYRFFWDKTIVKSRDMYNCLNLRNIEIIPNGVNLSRFDSLPKIDCQLKLGWAINKKHLIFAADPDRKEKNFDLTRRAIESLPPRYEVVLHYLKDVSHTDVPIYMNAADVLILSSLQEGSPNVIKEAMACNCPVVATDVGDINWILGNTAGCFISGFKVEDLSNKIIKAIDFGQKTNGRERIKELGLDASSVANKLVTIYTNVIKSKK